MATGSTYDFEQSAQQIIDDALANVGAIGPGQSATGRIRDHAMRALNRVLHSMDGDGLFITRTTRRTVSTTAAQAYVALDADVLSIDEPARFTRSGASNGSQIRAMSRDEYMTLSSRTDQAREPTRFYFERTLTTVRMYLWPVPSTSSDTIEYAAHVQGKDFDTLAQTPDFLSSWTKALVDGLTAELAPAYNQTAQAALFEAKFRAEAEKQNQRDSEKGSLVLVPWG